ncbi:acanthoscurrin-2-like [Mya arenaria]|uniref:acanthoscurrin-2-like n=1 Tax=Mya arenaria TaxID=6604 RepID=UPI0022E5516A|nr:acanthoscurrin-2-like [Mya arenaria]
MNPATMKSSACLILLLIGLSAMTADAQFFAGGFGGPRFGPPVFGGGWGGGGWGPGFGQGRGLAFLGSAALLSGGNRFGQAIGGLGLLRRGFGWGRPGFGWGRPGFGGGWGRPGFGGGWGRPGFGGGRGLALLGSAALLRSGNPLGRAVGAIGLGSTLFG